ncbi:MAG: C4-dicarboxylate ABC transporter [Candidatus Aminicenantes bacterium]|nr:C4-dicarboxylate ABC transporter [Candidatus Aminicenantes bacterium]
MIAKIAVVLISMVVAYLVGQWRRFSVELSLFLAAFLGAGCGAIFSTPPWQEILRHLVEGSFTYLDVILVFSTATIFMAVLRESGGIDYVVQATMNSLGKIRPLALFILMVIVLIPGALTGAGSVSLLVVGAPVAAALHHLGLSRPRIAAILFILAGLSAAAPPVNIWAMILCAGTAIPYVGFELPLGLPVIFLGTLTIFSLGWRPEKIAEAKENWEKMDIPKGMSWWRIALPFMVLFGLILAYRLWPFNLPVLGLPLQFFLGSITAWLTSPKKLNFFLISRETMVRILPLVSTMVVIGMLQQVMTATGVRGLISYAVISIPLVLLFISLAVIIPISEGVLTYGAAAILGIPLIWYLDSLGYHATVAISGLSLLWPLGDGLPPTALIGRLSVMVSNYEGSYWSFLRKTWFPWIIITLAGILMVIFSAKLSFLVRWSTG